MNGATILATVELLVVLPSFNGPRLIDSDPLALVRTLRHCPAYPTQPFEEIDAVRCLAMAFIPSNSHHR
jgi:hypothetical protein